MNTSVAIENLNSSGRLADLALQALSRWPLQVAGLELIKHRENAVFAVTDDEGQRFALRLHRPGYHLPEELRSELLWMQALNEAGLTTPTIISGGDGALFYEIPAAPGDQAVLCDLLAWVEGEPLGTIEHGVGDDREGIAKTYRVIGQIAARLHNHAENWNRPAGFTRHAWDISGIVGENPVWGKYWDNRLLTDEMRNLLLHTGKRLAVALQKFGQASDRYGLTHADFLPENFLVSGDRITLIDFDDAGFGWHLFDFATTLFFHQGEDHYGLIKDSMVEGYREFRGLPDQHLEQLETFLMARGLTYVGWLHTRRETETAQEIGPAVVESVCEMAEGFLADG